MKTRHRDAAVLALGVGLLGLYGLQATCGWQWHGLEDLQRSTIYKVTSGLALVAYLRMQWVTPRRRDISALLRHRVRGALAPLVLYGHATHAGYGYLALLVATYLGTAAVGLAHQPVLALRGRWLYTTWFILHLVGATALIALVGYHAVIAFAYE